MKFSQVKRLTIPNGDVRRIIGKEGMLWEYDSYLFHYVSLGDSIAAGQNIREETRLQWGASGNCLAWQYGTAGVSSTEIIDGTYTSLIRNKLEELYGQNRYTATSYARSGDVPADLRDKLNDVSVASSISKADLITVSIGANTVLGPALNEIGNYATNGAPTLAELDNTIEMSCVELEAGADAYGSYKNIFTRIAELNKKPNAKFIFTTVYNPMKYLWIDETDDEHNYENGYFSPIFTSAPNIESPGWWQDIGGLELDVRKFLYESAYIPEITQRINDPYGDGRITLAQWVEEKLNRLNGIIKQAIKDFGDPRFVMVDTKAVFDSFPDRQIDANNNFSDLVNVEIVRGQTIADIDWANLWDNIGDLTVAMQKLVEGDMDPHPEEGGHYALYRSFADAIGWETLTRYTISYNANGGSGTMKSQTITGLDSTVYMVINPLAFTPMTGYHFTNWLANNSVYSSVCYDTYGNIVYYYLRITSNTTLYAQWAINYHTLTVIQADKSELAGTLNNGDDDYDYRKLYIGGTEQSLPENVPALSLKTSTFDVAYGTDIEVWVSDKVLNDLTYNSKDCKIYVYNPATSLYETKKTARKISGNFKMPDGDVTIEFWFEIAGALYTFDAQVWWDVYIAGIQPDSLT